MGGFLKEVMTSSQIPLARIKSHCHTWLQGMLGNAVQLSLGGRGSGCVEQTANLPTGRPHEIAPTTSLNTAPAPQQMELIESLPIGTLFLCPVGPKADPISVLPVLETGGLAFIHSFSKYLQ